MSHSDASASPSVVLIANDQEWSARSLESILAPASFAVLRAYTGRQAIDLARNARPDVVIVDWRLPDIDGSDVVRTLRDDPRIGATTPVIMTSSTVLSRSQKAEAYKAGAWLICTQPTDGEIFLLQLGTLIRCRGEVNHIRDENLVDAQTGLYNWRGLERRAREIGATAIRRHEAVGCVAFHADVDGAGNGSAPEQVAQAATRHVGEIFRNTGRLSDAIGRLGREEFGIVAPGTGAAGIVSMVERLRHAVEGKTLRLGDVEVPVHLRAGYYAVPDFADAPLDTVEMLLRATTALRHARGAPDGPAVRSFDDVPAES